MVTKTLYVFGFNSRGSKVILDVVELILCLFGLFKVELIFLVELILLEVTICSFWLLQLILSLNSLINPLLHKYIQI